LLLLVSTLAVGLIANDWAVRGRLSEECLVYLCLVLLALVSVPSLPWTLGPIQIHRTWRIKVVREFEPFDPEAPDTSPNVAGPIHETAAALTPVGFTTAAHIWITNEAPRSIMFLSLFENPAARVRAMLITIYTGSGKALRRQTVLAFSTELTDGSEVATNNTATLSSTPACPTRTIVNLPAVRDPAELFQIHTAVLDQVGAMVARRLPLNGDPVDRQRQYTRREQERFVEAGYLYPEMEGAYYRATWKGAVLMAWKLLWPVSAIRQARLRQRSQALLRACRGEGHTENHPHLGGDSDLP
jgi:hypothetical protein